MDADHGSDERADEVAASLTERFDRLVEEIGPASMLVLIRGRMSSQLLARLEPIDIWQEALAHAWRDRERFTGSTPSEFRRWLVQVVENRLCDAVDHEFAVKRGRNAETRSLDELKERGAAGSAGARAQLAMLPLRSTTPSRVASYREEAAAMHSAVEALPVELREILRLRLFEELAMEAVAERTGVTLAVAKHRLRKGTAIYREALRRQLERE